MPNGRENLLPDDEQFGRDFSLNEKPLQVNLSEAGPWMVMPHLRERKLYKLELEQWPHVTRFKIWETSFRREREYQSKIWTKSDLFSAAPG